MLIEVLSITEVGKLFQSLTTLFTGAYLEGDNIIILHIQLKEVQVQQKLKPYTF